MADSLQIRGGNKDGIPKLADRELGYCKDEKTLHIGTPSGNQKIADAAVFNQITKLQIRTAGVEISTTDLKSRATSLENRATDLESRATSIESEIVNKLTASMAAAQADLAADADLTAVISAYNGLLAALRAAGIMTT